MENTTKDNKEVLDFLTKNVYVETTAKINDGMVVQGYDFNKGLDYEAIFKSYIHTGF